VFNFKYVSADGVISVINSLPNRHIAKPDDIPYMVLKYVSNTIAVPLSYAINAALKDGYFSNELKMPLCSLFIKKAPKMMLPTTEI
jgi:hypothetical protein